MGALELRVVELPNNPLKGTKFVLITTPGHPATQALLNRVYEVYADTVMKNPFHIPEMPIRNDMLDTTLDGFLRTPDFMT